MVDKVIDVLGAVDRMACWQVMRQSTAQRFLYWLQLSYPTDLVNSGAAALIDAKLWRAAEECLGIPLEGPLVEAYNISLFFACL